MKVTGEVKWCLGVFWKNLRMGTLGGQREHDQQNTDHFWNWMVCTWGFIMIFIFCIFRINFHFSGKKKKKKEVDILFPGGSIRIIFHFLLYLFPILPQCFKNWAHINRRVRSPLVQAFKVKTGTPLVSQWLRTHCRGHGFDPWTGDQGPAPHS